MVKRQYYKTRNRFIGRLMRSVVSIVILCALVLGISLLVKELATFSPKKIVKITKPLLSKLNININEEEIGEVAGKFVERISQTNLGSGVSSVRDLDDGSIGEGEVSSASDTNTVAKLGILADPQNDLENLGKAIQSLKNNEVNEVVVIGDLTNYGELKDLEDLKNILDSSGLKYYVIPGDHDLAETLDTKNFKQVFGDTHKLVNVGNKIFLVFNNSANYTIIDSDSMFWLETNVSQADFVILSQPLYTNCLGYPFKKMYMGSTREDPTDVDLLKKQEDVKDQGILMLDLLRESPNVRGIFAGDHHRSSKCVDSIRSTLTHYMVGPVTNLVEYDSSTFEVRQDFVLVSVFEDGSYQVENILLN